MSVGCVCMSSFESSSLSGRVKTKGCLRDRKWYWQRRTFSLKCLWRKNSRQFSVPLKEREVLELRRDEEGQSIFWPSSPVLLTFPIEWRIGKNSWKCPSLSLFLSTYLTLLEFCLLVLVESQSFPRTSCLTAWLPKQEDEKGTGEVKRTVLRKEGETDIELPCFCPSWILYPGWPFWSVSTPAATWVMLLEGPVVFQWSWTIWVWGKERKITSLNELRENDVQLELKKEQNVESWSLLMISLLSSKNFHSFLVPLSCYIWGHKWQKQRPTIYSR